MFGFRKKELLVNRELLCVLLFMIGFVFSQQVTAAGPDDFKNLIDKAQSTGEVRIIVTMRRPAMPDRASMSATDFDRQLKSANSAIQDSVLATLPAKTIIRPPRRFPYTAQLSLTVTAEGLTSLINNPNVISIQENIPEPPLLDQSVPHIFPNHATSSFTGNGWKVAILDSGVDKNHSFLTGKVVSEACYSTTVAYYSSFSVCPGGVSSSTASNSGLPCDPSISSCAHGTHVAGIATGNGSTFDGVARNADLIAIQVFSKFTSTAYCGPYPNPTPCILSWLDDQIDALNRVYALRSSYNIASVNMSLGGGQYTTYCDTDSRKPIFDALKSVGIATVVSSGNDGYTNAVGRPACISTAVAVGATEDTVDTRAWFSNNGPQLDLYAPGVGINSSVPGGGFASWRGTSMAAPHVAGAWAVLKQKFPSYSVDQIENLFKTTGVTVTSYSISRQRIDVTQALGDEPDLVVQSPGVSDLTLTPSQSFTASATVRNQGGATSPSTTLRYYRSTNSTINTSDTQIATDPVTSLTSGSTSLKNAAVTAPAAPGTYWIGACVDAVSGESNTGNNCSIGVQVVVSTLQDASFQPILQYLLRSHKPTSTSSSPPASAASSSTSNSTSSSPPASAAASIIIPSKTCAAGMIYDCEEKCVNEVIALDSVGDGVCNDETHEINLLCPAFQDDGEDCN